MTRKKLSATLVFDNLYPIKKTTLKCVVFVNWLTLQLLAREICSVAQLFTWFEVRHIFPL